jgi:hypothetical protein
MESTFCFRRDTCRLLAATRSIVSCVQRAPDRLAPVHHATFIAGGTREATFADQDRDEIAERYCAALAAVRVPAGEQVVPKES